MASGKILVIVESPAKCSKIEEYLGHAYKCVASFGHLRELTGLKSINEKYQPTFTNCESKEKQISKLEKLIASAQEVIIATDDDREGEGIGWHICDLFSLPVESTKRIIFNEITKKALTDAVNAPTVLNMDLVKAQQARQILDLIVGFKISPVLWANISQKKGLSAGRCQSPALKLIYENQKDIDNSPGTLVYTTTGYFTKNTIPFVLNKQFKSKDETEDFLVESVNHEHIYTCDKERKLEKREPIPFTTSKLQQQASNEMRITPKETMRICQTLYEAGLITYMRTDSTKYSKEFINKAKEYIIKQWGEDYVNETVDTLADGKKERKPAKKPAKKKDEKDDKKPNAQEAHEAIRPTNIDTLVAHEEMSPKEKRMYKLIWSNTVESCMSPSKYVAFTVCISSAFDGVFKYSTEKNVFPGWKIVRGVNDDSEYFDYLKTLTQKQELAYSKITANCTLKDLKSHYTEAKLVELLEKKGIGRPSTFSSIVDKIQERDYVKRENIRGKKIKCTNFSLVDDEIEEKYEEKEFGNENNKLVLQPTGQLVIDFLIKHFETFIDYDYTKDMEMNLDKIAKGEMLWDRLCRECDTELVQLIKMVQNTEGTPIKKAGIKIDENHTYMIGKYGPVIKETFGDKTSFIPVKKDIDVKKLEAGEYSLSELIDEIAGPTGKLLGNYNEEPIYLKSGKYGLYVSYQGKNRSVSDINKSQYEIKLADVIAILERTTIPFGVMKEGESASQKTVGVVRVLSEDFTIRNGKYGHYIFYKTNKMTKPKFLNFKGYVGEYLTDPIQDVLQWINDKHFSK